jgi:hypothetical protein
MVLRNFGYRGVARDEVDVKAQLGLRSGPTLAQYLCCPRSSDIATLIADGEIGVPERFARCEQCFIHFYRLSLMDLMICWEGSIRRFLSRVMTRFLRHGHL